METQIAQEKDNCMDTGVFNLLVGNGKMEDYSILLDSGLEA